MELGSINRTRLRNEKYLLRFFLDRQTFLWWRFVATLSPVTFGQSHERRERNTEIRKMRHTNEIRTRRVWWTSSVGDRIPFVWYFFVSVVSFPSVLLSVARLFHRVVDRWNLLAPLLSLVSSDSSRFLRFHVFLRAIFRALPILLETKCNEILVSIES